MVAGFRVEHDKALALLLPVLELRQHRATGYQEGLAVHNSLDAVVYVAVDIEVKTVWEVIIAQEIIVERK